MAQKHESHAATLPSTPTIYPVPPPVTLSDKLLSSIVPLPANPRIAYATFVPTADKPAYDLLESGRRYLVSRNESYTLLESILPQSHIDGEFSTLHVFMFTSVDHSDASLSALKDLPLDGVVVSEASTFDPQGLYPCSVECADHLSPCPVCLDPSNRSSDFNAAPPASNMLPRKPLRKIYARFLDAVRTRLIDDITRVSIDSVHRTSAHRLMNGFILEPLLASNEWAADWLSSSKLRPLVHCQLQVHLSASRLEVYSHLRSMDCLPLDFRLPLAGGTPMLLLPFGVPAYFLSIYNGPTSGITSQFEQSLCGLGAGEWRSIVSRANSEPQNTFRLGIPRRTSPTYVIGWLAVQNRQGEDKGVAIIWPSRLCLAFTASSQSAYARRALPSLPDLPPQLLPSPPPAPPHTLTIPSSPTSNNTTIIPATPMLADQVIPRRICTSPTSESAHAFRSLTLSKSSKVENVAFEVRLYVESVAKEREKERERIRRERDNAQSSASPRAAATPSSTITTSAPIVATGASPPTVSPPGPGIHPLEPPQPPPVVTPDANLPPPTVFYPTPPSASGKAAAQSTALGIDLVTASGQPFSTSQSESTPGPPPCAFDPFETIDNTWTQPPNDFMDIGGTYNMGFDMSVNIGTGANGGNPNTARANMDFEDGFIFTEDDFDFFDRPSAAARTARPIGPSLDESAFPLTDGSAPMVFSPSIFGQGGFSIPNVITPDQQLSPSFTSGVDALMPRLSELPHVQDPASSGQDIALPSPRDSSNSAPATPQVQLSPDRKRAPSVQSNFFDPIPFAQRHRLSDSKYHIGKFALPSPPDEEDRTESIPCLSSPHRLNHWKSQYNAATDPRVGVVRKLIGVKRKSFDQGPRRSGWHPSWLHENHDEELMVEDPENASDVASDEEMDEVDPAISSRPTTPPPAYLPLGPTLLHMQFYHAYLLPLSKPLRPPDAAVEPMSIPSVVPTSVPTPVSPAAALGASSEKSKSLEATGSMIAREIVENSLFADAWRASNFHYLSLGQPRVWPVDVSTLTQMIHSHPVLEGPVELQLFLHDEVRGLPDGALLQRVDTPMLSVGKGDSVVQVLPSSLRFWEKLGLSPRAGKKDLTAFLFLEDSGMDKQLLAEGWMRKLSTAYNEHHLGTHAHGSHSLCSVDGILTLRLDTLRKSLISFAAEFPLEQAGLIFYIAIPDSALTLASPLLRQISSAMKRLQKSRTGHPITLQLIPEHHIISHDFVPTDFEKLCFSIYHRTPHPVGRTMSRKILHSGRESRAFFRDLPFTLARPPKPTIHFSLGPARTLDVLDRHMLLHVGYRFSACGKWLLASCVDQRGESYDVGTWLTQDEVESSAILQVWNFAVQAAQRANVEWRLVISKLGIVTPSELDAWIRHLAAVSPLCRDIAPFHVTILSVDQNISWSLMPPSQPGTGQQTPPQRTTGKDLSKPFYVDTASASTYAIYPTVRIPLSSPPSYPWADCSFIPDNEGVVDPEAIPLLPVRSSILVHVPFIRTSSTCSALHLHFLHSCKSSGSSLLIPDEATQQEVTRNFHELTVFANLQGFSVNSLLPLHLSSLEAMQDALRQEETD